MQLIWHIFRKDARRLWWWAALSLILLAWMGHENRWRGDQMVGDTESWLNLLLVIVWVLITRVLVKEDPVIGDREFWLTLPCGWRSMLGAKALFLAAFIHLPYFLVQAAVLLARGFAPYAFLPQLLLKQLALFLMLTLPATALALVVRNMAQYLLVAVLILAGTVFLNNTGRLTLIGPRLMRSSPPSLWFTLAPLVAASLAIIVLQYARRRTGFSRAAGVVALLAAGAIYEWVPPLTSAAVACALSPAAQESTVSIKVGPPPANPTQEDARRQATMNRTRGRVGIRLPLQVSDDTPGLLSRYRAFSPVMQTSDGAIFSAPNTLYRSMPRFYGSVYLAPTNTAYLTMSAGVYDQARRGPVTLSGAVQFDYRRRGPSTNLGVMAGADVPEVGKCYSTLTPETPLREGTLKVDCESPRNLPYIRVVLIDQSGRRWEHTMSGSSGPWLSPLNHATTHFMLTNEENFAMGKGEQWQVPEDVLATSKLEITPEPWTGCKIVKYELPGVDLRRYAPSEK